MKKTRYFVPSWHHFLFQWKFVSQFKHWKSFNSKAHHKDSQRNLKVQFYWRYKQVKSHKQADLTWWELAIGQQAWKNEGWVDANLDNLAKRKWNRASIFASWSGKWGTGEWVAAARQVMDWGEKGRRAWLTLNEQDTQWMAGKTEQPTKLTRISLWHLWVFEPVQ